MPETNDHTIVTGAGDYEVRVHNVICKETTRICLCHAGRVKRLATAPDQRDVFWSAAEDGIIRYVHFICLTIMIVIPNLNLKKIYPIVNYFQFIFRQFDLRAKHTCLKNEKNVLVDLRTYMGDYYVEAKCISVNPLRSELIAVGVNDPYIRIYDRRMIKTVKVSF